MGGRWSRGAFLLKQHPSCYHPSPSPLLGQAWPSHLRHSMWMRALAMQDKGGTLLRLHSPSGWCFLESPVCHHKEPGLV